jgi:hypothetical protein
MSGTSLKIMGFGAILICAAPVFADYVPGMSCYEVRGFAQQVVEQKAIGVDLKEAVTGLRQSLGPEYRDTKRALEKIIQAIYTTRSLSTASSEEVATAYERACKVVEVGK